MYFQLLYGIHVEGHKKYQVTRERLKDGSWNYNEQPIIKSDKDLVGLFGSDKFKRIPDDIAKSLLQKTDGPSEQPTKVDDSAEETVGEAAQRGAAGIVELPGKEVTLSFLGDISETGIRVFVKNRKYTVTNADGVLLSAKGSLTKSEVPEFILKHVE